MKFNELLNSYIKELGCTAKELAEASGITPATLSRYINGKREPAVDSAELEKLSVGISKFIPNSDSSVIIENLRSALVDSADKDLVIINFNQLLSTLDINLQKLSKAVNYDPSYLYRIKAGERKPADLDAFISNICDYVASNYTSNNDLTNISKLTGCDKQLLDTKKSYCKFLATWLVENRETKSDNSTINNFLDTLDSFDLDEYMRTIHFDQFKVPNMPFYIIKPKTYYKLDGFKEAELDFYKSTVLSKSMAPILTYSDMPMEDMAQDLEFGKKWMFAMALAIKKGLHMNVIHNLNRPFGELLLGLQSWIPLYMTGQISPYYFKDMQTPVFHQLVYVSGACALEGQCVGEKHKDGKYTLYSSKQDITYYNKKAEHMLTKASPLMDVILGSESEKIKAFFDEDTTTKGHYKNRLSTLPAYAISRDLLQRMLMRLNKGSLIDAIWEDIEWQKNLFEKILSESTVCDEFPLLSKEEFDAHTPALSLGYLHLDEDILYSYEEYLEHIELISKYSDKHNNYSFKNDDNSAFRNIQILIKENEWAFISKKTSPSIKFAIRHPKLVDAIWDFEPIVE